MDMRDEWVRDLAAWASKNDSVHELWLFGSRADGTSTPESDVDLGLGLAPPNGDHDWALGNFYALNGQWRRELEAIVGRHVSLQPSHPRNREGPSCGNGFCCGSDRHCCNVPRRAMFGHYAATDRPSRV